MIKFKRREEVCAISKKVYQMWVRILVGILSYKQVISKMEDM